MREKESLALSITEEALRGLESSKGSITSAVQKLSRAANILDDKDLQTWCTLQLGDRNLLLPLKEYVDAYVEDQEEKTKASKKALAEALANIKSSGLVFDVHYDNISLSLLANESTAYEKGIAFAESKYSDLVRSRRGNDGTYYKTGLIESLSYIRKVAHEKATDLQHKLSFTSIASSAFEVIRESVDDRLLDISPDLAERLMHVFKSVNSASPEEWSHALTSVRRLLQDLADQVYPPRNSLVNGRKVDSENYINRLWAFMDDRIDSESNKQLAKAHIDFLGSLLQSTYRTSNKGVHSNTERLEAVRVVFHLYLSISHFLEFIDVTEHSGKRKPSLQNASMDEMEALLGISRKVAKEIVKTRVQEGELDKKALSNVAGIGPKTLKKALEVFDL